jgi:hypothetical protein
MAASLKLGKVIRRGDDTSVNGVRLWSGDWRVASNAAFVLRLRSQCGAQAGKTAVVRLYSLSSADKEIVFQAAKVDDDTWILYK